MLCLALFCSNRDNVTSSVRAVYSAGPTDPVSVRVPGADWLKVEMSRPHVI
jgi:hypothetical protein